MSLNKSRLNSLSDKLEAQEKDVQAEIVAASEELKAVKKAKVRAKKN